MKLICVGKIKENYINEAIKDYQKRINKYSSFEIFQVDNVNKSEKEIINDEGKALLSKINNKEYVILLDKDGKDLDSKAFSKKMKELIDLSRRITFVIGGSYGVSEEVKKRANLTLSFSKLTFPHQLFRVILLEQIYRSFKIINNETYHK